MSRGTSREPVGPARRVVVEDTTPDASPGLPPVMEDTQDEPGGDGQVTLLPRPLHLVGLPWWRERR